MTIEVTHANKTANLNEKKFSDFGSYKLKDELVLTLPDNTIKLSDLGNGKLSYARNSQSDIIKKIIQAKPDAQIELMPVLPIHIPSYKTDFFFLRFAEPLFIEQGSTLENTVSFPIEMGLFLSDQNKSSGFDFFSCNPLHSRFGLYGTTDNGMLCKHATISLDDKQIASQPFIHAKLTIKITNHLDHAISVGKLIFPTTDHDLYYRGNEVMMDGLRAIIKHRVGLNVIETVQDPIAEHSNWSLASRDTKKTDYKFSMEKGFD